MITLPGDPLLENSSDSYKENGFFFSSTLSPERTVRPLRPGSRVVALITKTNPRYASCLIISIDGQILSDYYKGTIKQSDCFEPSDSRPKITLVADANQVDLAYDDVYKAVRPGDLVLGVVYSMGDSTGCLISISKKEFGVIYAMDGADRLAPFNQYQMTNQRTGKKVMRKVALKQNI